MGTLFDRVEARPPTRRHRRGEGTNTEHASPRARHLPSVQQHTHHQRVDEDIVGPESAKLAGDGVAGRGGQGAPGGATLAELQGRGGGGQEGEEYVIEGFHMRLERVMRKRRV